MAKAHTHGLTVNNTLVILLMEFGMAMVHADGLTVINMLVILFVDLNKAKEPLQQ